MAKGSGCGRGDGGSAGGSGMVNASDVHQVAPTPMDIQFTDVGTGRGDLPPHIKEFLSACKQGYVDRLKAVVDAMDDDDRKSIGSKRCQGYGPLHSAAISGNLQMCKYLVEDLGFDVNSVDTVLGSGMSPLFCAALNDDEIVVSYLLEMGADPNKKDPYDGTTPLHKAVFRGSNEIAQLLLEKGANVNEPSSLGSPLVLAAARGKLSTMKILLEHHADPNKVSCKFGTPLSATLHSCPKFFAESTCLKCVKLLVEFGADVNFTNCDALVEIATTNGLTSCAKYLLEVEMNGHGRKALLSKAVDWKDYDSASKYSEVRTSGDNEQVAFKRIPVRRRVCKAKISADRNKQLALKTIPRRSEEASSSQNNEVRNIGVTDVSSKKDPKKSICYEDDNLDGWLQGKSYFILEPVGKKITVPFKLSRKIFQKLYGYQRDGVKWLWSLFCKSRGGILADDMGLGKTKQVSSFLAGMFCSELVNRALIIAPSIILPGWKKELLHIGIRTSVKSYSSGDSKKEENLESILMEGGILLISYDMFRDHYSLLSGDGQACQVNDRWDYVILDEGHTIKNSSSKTTKTVEKIKCANKIIVTGTPIQNNLKEFYTLFKICCPTILGDWKYFAKNFAKPIKNAQFKCASFAERCKSASARRVLKNHTGAYILRRTKQELKAQDKLPEGLPNKTELTVWLRLSPYQEELYRELLTNDSVKEKLKGAPLVTIAIMRKICYHPMLLQRQFCMEELGQQENRLAEIVSRMLWKLCRPPDDSANHEHSCKITFLKNLVASFITNGQRVLVFSQSRLMLDLIQDAFSSHFEDELIVRIDGTVKPSERLKIVNDFQEKTTNPARIFLLTTQVGGFGITLTEASRVVIVDPSWNPSVDDQSVDRCYRIGKNVEEDVVVYRLITIGTIEEKAYALQILKGTTSTAFNENKDIERYFTNKEAQKQLMAVPEKGFSVSLTKIQIEQNHGEEVRPEDDNDLRLCVQNFGTVEVTNHGKLFSKKAKPLPEFLQCHREDTKISKGSNAKRCTADNIIDGGKYAFEPKMEVFKQPVKSLVAAVNKHGKEIECIQEEMKRLKKQLVKKGQGNHLGAARLEERLDELQKKLKSLLSDT